MRIATTIAITLFLVAGCDSNSTDPVCTNCVDAGYDAAMVTAIDAAGADLTPAPEVIAIATTSDFTGGTGTLNTIALANRRVTKGIDNTLNADNGVYAQDRRVYVLNRTHGTVRVYPTNASGQLGSPTAEIGTGDTANGIAHNRTNPHDLIVLPSSDKAYVADYDNDAAHAIGVFDVARSTMVNNWIALPLASADSDGKPEANNLLLCGKYLFVTLQDLDTGTTFQPTGPGRIAVIDTTNDHVDTVIQLVGQNPIDVAAEGPSCDKILVAMAADQFGAAEGKGGIERVDLVQRKSLGLIITDTALGGHPSTISIASSTLAYSVLSISGMTFGSQVVAFNPQTATKGSTITQVLGYISQAKVAPNGELFIGVNTGAVGGSPAGLYIIPGNGTAMIGTAPIDLGQSPNAITFLSL